MQGVVALIASGALTYVYLSTGFITGRLLLLIPLLGALGLWFVAFGYPRRADGLAPGWWRLGLAVTAVASIAATFWLVGP
jgi:hypothetical protein